jgi:hypothetical protein
MILTLWSPSTEAHCHIYRVWRYPKPQQCFVALAPEHTRLQQPKRLETPEQTAPKAEQITFPLPALDFERCQEGDERLRAIAFLRGLSNGP